MAEQLYGLLAAAGSCIFFGSFGVPIKSPAVVAAKVDPVVFQCYKTAACFLTCWLPLLYVDLKFTWWGVVGAGIWVINGTCAIIAVQKAGLGVAQSLWSGLSIFVSFLWGAYVFEEPIKSVEMSALALFLMATGMVGVGLAASGKLKYDQDPDIAKADLEDLEDVSLITDEDGKSRKCTLKYGKAEKGAFTIGLLCAVYVGVANGSFMTPLKYANKEVHGAEYLFSFGVGAAMVTVVFAAAYFTMLKSMGKPVPSFQVQVAAKPALTTGLLWSIGNFCSIYATTFLGMAVGWPLVQCQLLVSTLWSIFYYEEITGTRSIGVFIMSALVVLGGVIMLGMYGL